MRTDSKSLSICRTKTGFKQLKSTCWYRVSQIKNLHVLLMNKYFRVILRLKFCWTENYRESSGETRLHSSNFKFVLKSNKNSVRGSKAWRGKRDINRKRRIEHNFNIPLRFCVVYFFLQPVSHLPCVVCLSLSHSHPRSAHWIWIAKKAENKTKWIIILKLFRFLSWEKKTSELKTFNWKFDSNSW